MREGGVEGRSPALTVVAGALTDLCIGLAIALRARAASALRRHSDLFGLRHHRYNPGSASLG